MSVYDSCDYAALIQKVKTGTPLEASHAFEQLVLRHSSHLFIYLRSKGLSSEEQKDISNETWTRAWQKITKWEDRGIDIFPCHREEC